MPTTTNYAFPTPGLTGSLPNVPSDMATLADAVDAALKAEEDARKAVTDPSSVITNAWTAQTGWTVDSQQSFLVGKLMMTYVTCTRTGADITSPSNGNISNSPIAQLGGSYALLNIISALSSGDTGRLAGFAVLSTGVLRLASLGPGGDLTTGTQLTCGGLLLLA